MEWQFPPDSPPMPDPMMISQRTDQVQIHAIEAVQSHSHGSFLAIGIPRTQPRESREFGGMARAKRKSQGRSKLRFASHLTRAFSEHCWWGSSKSQLSRCSISSRTHGTSLAGIALMSASVIAWCASREPVIQKKRVRITSPKGKDKGFASSIGNLRRLFPVAWAWGIF